jgi:uncharacterized protein YcaQ
MSDQFSSAEVRRLTLAAQGFGDPRPRGRVDRRHLRNAMARLAEFAAVERLRVARRGKLARSR